MAITGRFGKVQKIDGTDAVLGRLSIRYIRWVDGAAADDALIIDTTSLSIEKTVACVLKKVIF